MKSEQNEGQIFDLLCAGYTSGKPNKKVFVGFINLSHEYFIFPPS